MVLAIFGLGGGSDFSSACLIAAVESDTDKACDNVIIFTAFAPVVIGEAIDLTQSIRKYTGLPYFTATDKITTSKAYQGFTEKICDNEWPVIIDNRRNNAYGIFVPSRSLFPKEFNLCVESLRSLIFTLSGDTSPQILAVDTGGDCLRGLVKGMGDRDISHLFGGVVDTRDVDSLHLITEINGRPTVEITIFGPGSDGETSVLGLEQATEVLVGGGNDGNKITASSVRLLEWGDISSKYSSGFRRITAWANPLRGSTISHILRAIASYEGNTISSENVSIEIERQGQVVSTVPAKFLTSFWRVSVCLG